MPGAIMLGSICPIVVVENVLIGAVGFVPILHIVVIVVSIVEMVSLI
jgi:hypothetical protein